MLSNLKPAGRLPAADDLELVLGLPLRNRPALTNLLDQLYDPLSTNFHQYLTPQQFTEMFGPTAGDYQTVATFVASNGLSVTASDPNRSLLTVHGSVQSIERLFHINLMLYQHPAEPRLFFAPDAEPSVDLLAPLLHVTGLDNFHVPQPGLRPSKPSGEPKPNVGTGPNGTYWGSDFRTAYTAGTSLNGSGQVVGLLQFDGYYAADITAYETQTGLPNVNINNVLVGSFNGIPTTNVAKVTEVSLDIEMVITMAPNISQLIVYETTNSFLNVLIRMASDNLAKQLSSSWAIGDNASADQIYQQFAAQGQTFFQSSGDGGAYYTGLTDREDTPYVTIVGGTILTTDPAGAWVSEMVWNDNDGTNAAGGGIATNYLIPVWQLNIDMSTNHGSTAQRNVPDVAMVAQGVWAIFNNGTSNALEGTSVATPLWAGFNALVNQKAAIDCRPPVGFLNPVLYSLGRSLGNAQVFHDITTGNNTNNTVTNNFFAVSGYDLCTGWGTPTGTNLINTLASFAGAVWVAFGTPGPGNGTYTNAFNTLARATNAVPVAGTIAIEGPSSTTETISITKPMTLRAAGGITSIGH